MTLSIRRTTAPRARPKESELGFGKFFADHMLMVDYAPDKGWHQARIEPYGPLSMDPAAGVFHYGQAMFEGLKAFRAADGRVNLFRPGHHCERMARGAPRLCIPAVDPKQMLQWLTELVKIDADWVPSAAGTSLYMRPTLIASEGFLGVRPSTRYLFFAISSPVGAYYSGGVKPVRIWVEREQTRAAHGGLGAVKAGANYAASLLAAQNAKKEGYDQVLWLDAARHDEIEEVGTMNLFAQLGDELVTPPLSDSILAGVTRDCVIALSREAGLKVVERTLTITELQAAHAKGALKEVFGSGTAAVISPVGELALGGKQKLAINKGEVGPLAGRLYEEISGIQRGTRPDKYGWLTQVV
jgi:branched-chain amino acid aminotransferase